jgi:hypothetical protein
MFLREAAPSVVWGAVKGGDFEFFRKIQLIGLAAIHPVTIPMRV